MNEIHPFHLVDFSPWPILGALSAMSLLMGLMKWFHLFKLNSFILSFSITIFVMFQWWRDFMRESTFQGNHTFQVSKGLRWGMISFITSEVFVFLWFFWMFFHGSLSLSNHSFPFKSWHDMKKKFKSYNEQLNNKNNEHMLL